MGASDRPRPTPDRPRPPTTAGEASRTPPSERHILALDGVRGIAILAVLLVHLSWSTTATALDRAITTVLTCGWMGVDLFFVLSGFLITGILIDTKGSPSYFRAFYLRRALRILPLYYAFVVALVVVLPHLHRPTPLVQSLTAHQAWLWGHADNILAARDGLKVLPPSVAIAWSLSIEEQFYLVWPLIVWLASRAALRWVCVGCIVGAMLIRLAIATRWPTAAFTLMPARMDALALGGLIAICYRDPVGWRRVQRLWAPVGAAALTVIIVMYVVRGNMRVPDLGLSTIGYGSADWLSAALLVYALTTPVTVLTAPVLRFFGRYSYALYLLHLPVLLAMHPVTDWLVARPLILGSPLPWMMLSLAISIGATTCLALVSWILLERPFLSLKRYVPYGRSSGARPAIVAGPPTEPPLSVSSAL